MMKRLVRYDAMAQHTGTWLRGTNGQPMTSYTWEEWAAAGF
jgi:hypothetical protein